LKVLGIDLGTSRIPYISQMVKEELGITPSRGVDPELAVAQGAVIRAGCLSGQVHDILLLDVIPGSYGTPEAIELIERSC